MATLIGGAGNDTLSGGSGDDTLSRDTRNDTLNGGVGNDLFIHNVTQNIGSIDYYDGGTGTDTLKFILTQSE